MQHRLPRNIKTALSGKLASACIMAALAMLGSVIVTANALAEELLDLPSYVPSSTQENTPLIELELLTSEELKSLYAQPAPASSNEAVAPPPNVQPAPPNASANIPTPPSAEMLPPNFGTVADDPNPVTTAFEPTTPPATDEDTPLLFMPTEEQTAAEINAFPDNTAPPSPEIAATATGPIAVAPPENDEAAGVPTPPATPAESAALDAIVDQPTEVTGDWGKNSLMFKEEEIEAIRYAIASYRRKQALPPPEPEPEIVIEEAEIPPEEAAEPLIEELFSEEPAAPVENVRLALPVIYVGTIMYLSPKQWSLWINGKRISSKDNAAEGSAIDGIEIISVAANRVTLDWTPDREIDAFKENTNLIQKKGDRFRVTMRSNQALLGRALQVNEGRAADKQVKAILARTQPGQEVVMPVEDPNAGFNGIFPPGMAIPGQTPPSDPTVVPGSAGADRNSMNTLINQYKDAGSLLGGVFENDE